MRNKEEYQDERWKTRADEIRELDHHRCAMCGAEGVELHVHHLAYQPSPFHLWDATDNELVTLCKDCHEKIHQSIIRPTLDGFRKLHRCMFEDGKDCTDCKWFVQPYLLSEEELGEWRDFLFDGPCKRFGGTDRCRYKEPIKCGECAFYGRCGALWIDEQSIACSDFEQRRCQFCEWYYEEPDKDGSPEGYCARTSKEICWANSDCCAIYKSRVRNRKEMEEYLKTFD